MIFIYKLVTSKLFTCALFTRKIIKNRFLNILILAGLAFNVANVNAFSAKNANEVSQSAFKSFIESVKSDPVSFLVGATICAAIASGLVAFVVSEANKNQAQKDAYDKKLKETCIVCDKANKECSCDLLEKIKHVFEANGFIETKEYIDGNFSKRYCNWLTKEIKSVILKINNINMKFNYKGDSESTILHIACDYGHEPIIKWLVEDMFININSINNKGLTASKILKRKQLFFAGKIGIIGENFTSAYDFFSRIDECFLDKKEELQNELLDCVKIVKSLLRDNKTQEGLKLIAPDVRSKLGYIRKLIESKKTPGFAKQLVMSDLIFIHQNFKEFICEKAIIDLYKHIAFNYTFLNDSRFASALAFAESKDGKSCKKERSYSSASTTVTLLFFEYKKFV